MDKDLEDRRRLSRARRMAQRNRAGVACTRCKRGKVKCSDYRPCARCRNQRTNDCFQDLETQPSQNKTKSPATESRSFTGVLQETFPAGSVRPYKPNLDLLLSQSWTNQANAVILPSTNPANADILQSMTNQANANILPSMTGLVPTHQPAMQRFTGHFPTWPNQVPCHKTPPPPPCQHLHESNFIKTTEI
jgi:hypothetical protein